MDSDTKEMFDRAKERIVQAGDAITALVAHHTDTPAAALTAQQLGAAYGALQAAHRVVVDVARSLQGSEWAGSGEPRLVADKWEWEWSGADEVQ